MSFFPKMEDLTWNWLKKKLAQSFLPLGLIVAIVVALLLPEPGDEISKWEVRDFRGVQTINTVIIFGITGLTLKTEDMVSAITAFRSLAYGLVTIIIITPALGFGLIEIPFEPKEFARGLVVFAAVPTTLTYGVALVTQVKGNTGLALMLTACSNLLGVLTVPFTVNLIISSAENVDIDTIELLLKLVSMILVPLIIGKTVVELSSRAQQLGKLYRTPLELISRANLILIVWQTLSRSRDILLDQKLTHIAIIIASGIAVHVLYLTWNYFATMVLHLPPREKRAVLIMASQKTLPVAVTVISFLDERTVGDHGLLTIPCLAAYLAQLLIDSVAVSIWTGLGEKREDSETKPIYLESCAIHGTSETDSSEQAIGSKLPVTMVDNPLADMPETGSTSVQRSLQTGSKGMVYMAVNVVERRAGVDSLDGLRLSEEHAGEVCSSSGSFVSAHTVVSSSTFTSTHDTPRSFDVS